MNEKKRGRPYARDPRNYPLRVRLTKSEHDALNEACAKRGMTITDIVLASLRHAAILPEKQ